MYRDKKHVFKINNEYITEKSLLKNKFKGCKKFLQVKTPNYSTIYIVGVDMEIEEKIKNEIKDYNEKFNELVNNDKLNISTIEDLLLDNYKSHQKNMNQYTEELLSQKIDEKELISKKNKNGKRKDIN